MLAGAEGAPCQVKLLATSVEVALARSARDALQGTGTPPAVVSMPSWELFEARNASYQASGPE